MRPFPILPILLTPPSPFGFLPVRGQSSGDISACLDPLGEPAAREVLDAEGLSFEDRPPPYADLQDGRGAYCVVASVAPSG